MMMWRIVMDQIEKETEMLRLELHSALMLALEPIFKSNRERAGIVEDNYV